MKFIHVADIHASRERLPQTLSILNTLTERAKEGDIDFIIFAGDFWDSTITATKGSGFSDIISAIRELEKHVYRIFFIYGTPSHEPLGSLSAFSSDTIQITSRMSYCACDKFEIIAIPEPRRSDYIGQSIKETDDSINKSVKEFIKAESKRHVFSDNKVPRIVVYHGEVKGAVYQNGVYASSPTAIPKELLQSLNADYYAFGHIHMPQEVFKNGWYSGSACPKNFGETHDGHYNLVTIENGETKVEEVSFGLPVYETYNIFYSDFTKTKRDFTNKHIRLCFDCTKEERKALNLKQVADEIKEKTGALSVKLEPNVTDGEIVAKSEVVKRKSLVEKMTEYAKEKSLKVPKYAKELLQNIQDSTLAKLAYPQHSFELLSLSLRGAIGIRDGQGKEDFELNFESLEDGVVCLVGQCGKGKSTILENCHPYPKMLSRDGTLKEHFYLKDSHRILIYKDENGLYYKISMLIDGKTATGKAAYYVKTSKDREVWHSVPEVDGSLESYKDWVNNTFGNIDVYLRTAFFAKEQTRDATDISDTTKGERMELLSKLAGTEHLKEVSVIARGLRKDLEDDIERIDIELKSYNKYEETIKENDIDIKSWSDELKEQKKTVKYYEKKIEELKVKDAEYKKMKAASETQELLYKQYKKEFDDKLSDKQRLNACDAKTYSKLEASLKIIKDNTELIEVTSAKLKAGRKLLDQLTTKVMTLNKKYSEHQTLLEKTKNEANLYLKQTCEINDICPTCGSPLSEHKRNELEKHNKDMLDKFNELTKESKKISLETIELYNKTVEADKERDAIAIEVEGYEKDVVALTEEKQACVDFVNSLDKIYSEYTKEEVLEMLESTCDELEALQSKMESLKVDNTLEDVSDELEKAERKLRYEQNRQTELAAMIKSAEKENARYQKELEAIESKKEELKELTEKVTAYNFIENAFSNNGIPAVELRESAPEIADIANKILSDSYGNKFEIRFGSTSELKANRKANEDFNIIVYDTENGDEKTIDLVSSGERIWIKQALFYAFSIVQMNRTGFNFRTRLIDESDGSLDGGLRPKYLKMVESAHKISDSRITLLITHSQEIKDIAQQIIEI